MFQTVIDILEGGLWDDWLSDRHPFGLYQLFLLFLFIRVILFTFPALALQDICIDLSISTQIRIGGVPVIRVLITIALISEGAKILQTSSLPWIGWDTKPALITARAYDRSVISSCFKALIPHGQ
jgi:hypothetical protein